MRSWTIVGEPNRINKRLGLVGAHCEVLFMDLIHSAADWESQYAWSAHGAATLLPMGLWVYSRWARRYRRQIALL